MEINGPRLAAAIRAKRAADGHRLSAVVDAAARICFSSPRTLQRRIESGHGLSLDEAQAIAAAMDTNLATLMRIAAALDDDGDLAVAS